MSPQSGTGRPSESDCLNLTVTRVGQPDRHTRAVSPDYLPAASRTPHPALASCGADYGKYLNLGQLVFCVYIQLCLTVERVCHD